MTAESDAEGFRPPRFEVRASDAPDGALLLVVEGELDLVTEPQLTAALADAAGRRTTIDLSALAFMDSTGLRTLLSAAREHPELRLRGPLQPPVQRLLELTQTLAILPFD